MAHHVIYAKKDFSWWKEDACNARPKSQAAQNVPSMANNAKNVSYNISSLIKQQVNATVKKHTSFKNFNANYVQASYCHVTNAIAMVQNACNVWVSILCWIVTLKNVSVSRVFMWMRIIHVSCVHRLLLVVHYVINKVENVMVVKRMKTLL